MITGAIRLFENSNHLLIVDLPEIPVMRPNGPKGRRNFQTNHILGQCMQLLQNIDWRHRQCNDQPHGAAFAQHPEGDAQCGSCGSAIVNDDHRSAFDCKGRSDREVKPLPALKLGQDLPRQIANLFFIEPELVTNLPVDRHLHRLTIADRTNGDLRISRRTDLSHQQNIERQIQCLGNLLSHRHPATRQRHPSAILWSKPDNCRASSRASF